MRHLLVGTVAVLLAACAGATTDKGPAVPAAAALLKDKDGREVGVARFAQVSGGVRITLQGRGLPPGDKGVHIHAVGMCQPPEFTSAGAHFNPEARKHGLQSPEGPHAGDLPNLRVGPNGEGAVEYVNPRVTLEPGKPNSLFQPAGTSVIVHAQGDDGMTDPTGNSGGRMACGVVTR